RVETGVGGFRFRALQAIARRQCRNCPMRCRSGRLPYRKWYTHAPPSRPPPERDHSTVKNGRTLNLAFGQRLAGPVAKALGGSRGLGQSDEPDGRGRSSMAERRLPNKPRAEK